MNVTVLSLLGLLVASWIYHAWQVALWASERARLINAALAESPAQFVALERERVRPAASRRDDEDAPSLEPIGMAG